MSDKKLPIRFRQATVDDANFIFNSWLKSYRHSHFSRMISNTIYYTEQHKILEKLVKECKTVVACSEDDPNQLYGYINAGTIDGFLVINYIYVKHSFRNMGIGKALLDLFEHNPETAAVYTMHTRIADRLAPKYNMVFHPYLLFQNFDKEQTSSGESNGEDKN